MIRVLLTDDHPIILKGCCLLLKRFENIQVVGTATNGKEAVEIAKQDQIDVAILDIEMPIMNGIEATRLIKMYRPTTHILILSMHNEVSIIRQLIRLGISGYILKDKEYDLLVKAIYEIHKGNNFFAEEVDKLFKRGVPSPSITTPPQYILTEKEIQILTLIGECYSSVEIAKKLGIKKPTVETHRQHLLKKLRLESSKHLIRYAIKNGFA